MKKPFEKAILEFQNIMTSAQMSPLDKLYKLQYLSLMDHFERNKDFFLKADIDSEGRTKSVTPIVLT